MINEIAKFDALADDWWDPEGPMRALHWMNPVRLAYIQEQTTLLGKKVLDVGCGGGLLTEAISTAGAAVIKGIDLSGEVLSVAREHAIAHNILVDYELISVHTLAQQQPQSFDVITCMEMLEHVPEADQIIHSCSTLLKPGGRLFFSTINRHPKAFVFAILGAEYILNMLPKGTHAYAQFIRPSELDQWARQADLHLNSIKGITYLYLARTFVLSTDVSINYITCYRKE